MNGFGGTPMRRARLLAAFLCVLGSSAPSARAAVPPNFVFVYLDDMGYGDLGCYGGNRKNSPVIDRLAAEGIRFTQFYVNAPICSPSRVGVTTGQYPARWRITSYLADRAYNNRRGLAQFLDPQAPSLARMMAARGYHTAHVGKWHMGGGRDVGEAPLPSAYGFASSIVQFEGLGDRILPVFRTLFPSTNGYDPLGLASQKLGRGRVEWAPRCDISGRYVDRAIAEIRAARAQGKPFYVNLWPDDVHTPNEPSPANMGDGSKRARYLGALRELDADLGRLFEFVRADAELARSTVIVLASDNGPEGGAGVTGGLRGSKGCLYEGGIREPLIVWGPGVIPAVRVGTVDATTVVAGFDLPPSLLAMAGAPVPSGVNFDGIDRHAAMLGTPDPVRPKPLCWVRPPERTGPALAIRDGRWKLLCGFDGSAAQLYDLDADRAETADLAAAEPDTAARLRRSLLDWYSGLHVKLPPAIHRVDVTEALVRSGPGLEYPIVGKLSLGAKYVVNMKNAAGNWRAIWWKGGRAWIRTSTISRTTGTGVVVAVPDLNVRSGPASSYARLGQAHSPQIYVRTGTSGTGSTAWHRINWGGMTAWVNGAYTRIRTF